MDFFSSIWNMVSRHKGKITIGLIVLTSVVVFCYVALIVRERYSGWITDGLSAIRSMKNFAVCAVNPFCVVRSGISGAIGIFTYPVSLIKTNVFGPATNLARRTIASGVNFAKAGISGAKDVITNPVGALRRGLFGAKNAINASNKISEQQIWFRKQS